MEKTPKHIVLIPDGNRRWAKSKGLESVKGHEKSTQRNKVVELLDEALRLKIRYISFWAFSTENWRRSDFERNFLFSLLVRMAKKVKDYCRENKIRFRHIGRKDRLPNNVVKVLEEFEDETNNYDRLNMQLLLDYGGRDEIIRAVNKILSKAGHLGDIKEKTFSNYLDTKEIPDPDLIIRTGGEKRLSGLMSYQSAYAELYFIDKYFPDFTPEDLRKAVEDFGNRKRRFGGD